MAAAGVGNPPARTVPGVALIHISGSPGTGKSFIGEQLAEKWKGSLAPLVRVVETDSFIQDDTNGGKKLLELKKMGAPLDAYDAAWENITAAEVERVVQAAKDDYVRVLILVGIMNNMSPSPGRIYPLHQQYHIDNRWKVFLDPPTATAWKQFENRWKAEPPETRGPLLSYADYVKYGEIERRWHIAAGYRRVENPKQVFDEINDYIAGFRSQPTNRCDMTPSAGWSTEPKTPRGGGKERKPPEKRRHPTMPFAPVKVSN